MKKLLLSVFVFFIMSTMVACNQTGTPVNPGNQSTAAPTDMATSIPTETAAATAKETATASSTPSAQLVQKTVSLFYADIGANNLYEEKRQITVDSKSSTADIAKRALEEQIKGTKSKNRTNPLNAKIRVISLRIKEDLVNLNLSKELYDSCEGTTGETMAVDAIVKVMLQFPEIKQILVKVEGKTFVTGHNIYDQPLTIDNITWSEPG